MRKSMTELHARDRANRVAWITLLIHHGDIDPTVISRELDLKPFMSWKKGDSRITPAGNRLKGTHRDTRWSFIWDCKTKRGFGIAWKSALAAVERSERFLRRQVPQGMRVELVVRCYGGKHFGTTIEARDLAKLAGIGIDLGFEAFPQAD